MDFPVLLTSLNLIGITGYAFWNHYSKRAISNRFDKSLLVHKSELEKDLKNHQAAIDKQMAEANAGIQKELKKFELISNFELQKSAYMHDKRFEHIFEFIKESSISISQIIIDMTQYHIARDNGDLAESAKTWLTLINRKNDLLNRAAFLFVFYDYDIVKEFRQNLIRIGSSITSLGTEESEENIQSAIFLSAFSAAACLASLRHFAGIIAKEDCKQATLDICAGLGLTDLNVAQALQFNRTHRP